MSSNPQNCPAPIAEFIFPADRYFASCHASTLVSLGTDHFLAAWFAGTKEGNDDVAIWITQRDSQGWAQPRLIAKVCDQPHWNPVLLTAADGLIHLFFKVGRTIPRWQTWTMSSDDNGINWSEPRELVPGNFGGRGPVKNKPIILSNGIWLAPASLEKDKQWDAFVDRSEDNGKTWQATEIIPMDRTEIIGEGVIQPTLWESRPGHVHMLLRSSCGAICRSNSDNYGRTWSRIFKTDLPNNNSGIDLAQLHDGTLALAYNPVSGNWAPRTPLSIALSTDNGRTWPRKLDIEIGPGGFSYPAIIPTDDGMALTYSWNSRKIAFWQASLQFVTAIATKNDRGR